MAIEQGLQYSVAQLREIKDQHGYNFQVGLVRAVPNQILMTARTLAQQGIGNLGDVLDYLNGAFYFYRSCVNMDPGSGIPMVRANTGIYEWPKPVEFPWIERDKVSLFGKLVRGPVHFGVIERPSELDQVVMAMERTFPFAIPSRQQVGFIQDGEEWQKDLLKVFNPLRTISTGLRDGNVQEIEVRSQLFAALRRLSTLQEDTLQVINS